jgi:hypothetical protein
MNYQSAKNSTGILAGVTGLLFALLYVALEFLQGIPGGISLYGDANTISVWHFPLIWILAGIFFYSIFSAVRIVRSGKVKERKVAIILSVTATILLALFWVYPMLAGLLQCFGGSDC